jgi:hypothetical protein
MSRNIFLAATFNNIGSSFSSIFQLIEVTVKLAKSEICFTTISISKWRVNFEICFKSISILVKLLVNCITNIVFIEYIIYILSENRWFNWALVVFIPSPFGCKQTRQKWLITNHERSRDDSAKDVNYLLTPTFGQNKF